MASASRLRALTSRLTRAAVLRAIGVSLSVGVALAVVGCTSAAPPEPSPEPSTSASPPPTAEVEPAEEPALVADGTAEANLPYFDLVNSRLLEADPMPGGRPIIDNLVAAGFDKATMQVTADGTAIGREADSVQFSVQIGDSCLLGQASPTGYTGTVAPVVPGSGCLLGITRAIDW